LGGIAHPLKFELRTLNIRGWVFFKRRVDSLWSYDYSSIYFKLMSEHLTQNVYCFFFALCVSLRSLYLQHLA